ncbi:EF-hand domain-containing protein [Lacinutrix sp. WUR7]|uniref:EF-hand domain-containing protein n=1 Tax=Lacinutrix sp. WUR7 TaxID=2653681 RepID=UPI00193D871C|nr:EF-hand domain-containing protein [Lacinutrix sp. WUR7]QRM90226.1 EF-hand domain-containing protein [Lacinutrix sp. WUR7]
MKSSTIKKTVLAFGIVVLISNSAFAQSQNRQEKTPPSFSELIKKMDANEDGKLSKDEIKGPLKENFSKIDTDEDGFISEEEFKNAPKPKGRGKK